MLSIMRLLVALACLWVAVPSQVMSFNLPEDRYAEDEMAEVGEVAAEENDIHTQITKDLLRTVFGAKHNNEVGEDTEEGAEEITAKRSNGNRPEREIRARAHAMFPFGRRNPITHQAKFTFGKRSQMTRQQLLEELQLQDTENTRNQNKIAMLDNGGLYDQLQDNHEVQKDAYPAFSFGKRGMSAFSYGKRAMPSFAFGKRALGSMFAFGRRDWIPSDDDIALEESSPYQLKRADLAFAFGKRENQ